MKRYIPSNANPKYEPPDTSKIDDTNRESQLSKTLGLVDIFRVPKSGPCWALVYLGYKPLNWAQFLSKSHTLGSILFSKTHPY